MLRAGLGSELNVEKHRKARPVSGSRHVDLVLIASDTAPSRAARKMRFRGRLAALALLFQTSCGLAPGRQSTRLHAAPLADQLEAKAESLKCPFFRRRFLDAADAAFVGKRPLLWACYGACVASRRAAAAAFARKRRAMTAPDALASPLLGARPRAADSSMMPVHLQR